MKKLLQMLQLSQLLQSFLLSSLVLSLFFALFLTGCATKNPTASSDEHCGSSTYYTKNYTESSFDSEMPETYIESGIRTYYLYIGIDSICTDAHITGAYNCFMNQALGSPFTFKASMEWFLFYERTDVGSMSFSDSLVSWFGSIPDVGLKQAYGEDAGSVNLYIYISFPTRGSLALDSAFFREHFRQAEIKLVYNYHNHESTADLFSPDSDKDFIFASNNDNKIYRDFTKIPLGDNKTVAINRNLN